MKKICFVIVLLLLSWVVLEALSFGIYYAFKREPFTFSRYREERAAYPKQVFEGIDAKGGRALEVVHPYLGYVFDPAAMTDPEKPYPMPISRYGFLDTKDPVQEAAPDKLVVAVTGGSFAGGVAHAAHQVIADAITACPAYRDKRVTFLSLALGGYKQPQQLMTLSYLLSLGAHFDFVINIDGFNEVALPPTENVPKGVFPFYPRMWFYWVNALPRPEYLSALVDVQSLVEKRNRLAALSSRPPLSHSVLMNLVWKRADMALTRRISDGVGVVQRLKVPAEQTSFAATGPFEPYASDAELYDDLAEKWKQASLQMHRLCAANGIAYFHFLQPNQYVEGSKPMGEEEKKTAYLEDHPYRPGVESGYPLLLENGRDLVQAGVSFTDLTMIFSGVTEPLYMDTCCHVLYEGYAMVAERIGETIAAEHCAE